MNKEAYEDIIGLLLSIVGIIQLSTMLTIGLIS
jgi:hypothetical protein